MTERIPIWGEKIPFNSSRLKKCDMNLTNAAGGIVMINWIRWVFGKKLMKDNHGHDDFVMNNVIGKGQAKASYEDVPTITPYLVEGAPTAVVVAPGGGFCMVSTDNEGTYVAKMLNSYGISAFVLDYRLDPYRFPIPCLDMQRAIRYVRHHADEFGIDKNSVGAMGFSAGGYTAAGAAILLGDAPVEADGYTPDEVDAEDGMPDYCVPIYPVVGFKVNPNMLANLVGPEFYTDPEKRNRWTDEFSLVENVKNIPSVPQFLCYGTKDPLGEQDDYAAELNKYPEQNKVMLIEKASHGFSGQKKWTMWEKPCADWILETAKKLCS